MVLTLPGAASKNANRAVTPDRKYLKNNEFLGIKTLVFSRWKSL
jgi:hypothetical protein